jgi:hypothetical protein
MTDEAEILFALVSRRYGARLDPAQLDEVKEVVEAIARDAAALRAAVIVDGDEPAQPFVPFRAEP